MQHRARSLQGFDEGGRRAVEARRLGGVEFDAAVVDAEAGQCRQDVFDEGDTGRAFAQSRATGRPRDAVGEGQSRRPTRQVGADENEARVLGGRDEAEADPRPGHDPDPANRDGRVEGSLVSVPDALQVNLTFSGCDPCRREKNASSNYDAGSVIVRVG